MTFSFPVLVSLKPFSARNKFQRDLLVRKLCLAMVSKDHGPQRDILFAAVAESNVLTPVSVSLKPIRVSVNFQIDLLVGLLCLVDKCAKIMAIKERWHFLLS